MYTEAMSKARKKVPFLLVLIDIINQKKKKKSNNLNCQKQSALG